MKTEQTTPRTLISYSADRLRSFTRTEVYESLIEYSEAQRDQMIRELGKDGFEQLMMGGK